MVAMLRSRQAPSCGRSGRAWAGRPRGQRSEKGLGRNGKKEEKKEGGKKGRTKEKEKQKCRIKEKEE